LTRRAFRRSFRGAHKSPPLPGHGSADRGRSRHQTQPPRNHREAGDGPGLGQGRHVGGGVVGAGGCCLVSLRCCGAARGPQPRYSGTRSKP
jgi:hypothetical protein